LPDPLNIYKSYVKYFPEKKIYLYLVFGKITGLHFLYWQCAHENDGYCNYSEHIYRTEEDLNQSITLLESNDKFKPYDNLLAKSLMKYSFAYNDKIDYRWQQWYLGEWINYDKLGIASDCSHIQYSQWFNNLGKEENIDKFDPCELITIEYVVNLIEYFPHYHFTCDNCKDYIIKCVKTTCKNILRN